MDIEKGTKTLTLHHGGVFIAEGPDHSVIGTYAVGHREEPGFGQVQLLELSRGVEFLGVHSEFVVEASGDSLHLVSPWEDSESHVLALSSRR